jgi:DNA-binding transcriptional regulator YhcF (GntR family)
MTVREIAEFAGVSVQTVRRTAELNVGYVFEKGKKAEFSEKESIEIMRELKKKGFVQPVQNGQVPVQNGQVITRSDLAAFGTTIVTEVMKQFLPLLQNQPKQIEFAQDYYTIKGYASKLGQQILFSEALNLGRLAGKISREKGLEIRKVDDERFGLVNSYSVKVLEEVFQI